MANNTNPSAFDLGEFDLDSFDFGDFDSLDTGINIQQQPIATPEVSNIVTSLRKRAMVVFFVIDISGSMRGARIGSVNDAIRNLIPELKKRERSNTTAEIRVAILEFSTRATWRTLSPEPVATYQYRDIENVGGGTNYGAAFAALNEKLSRQQFLNSTAGAYTPLIIFMTDGKPSDMGLYHEELVKLKRNKWFQYATRVGIAIEEGALSSECKSVLLEFTENGQNVYEAKNTIVLAKQIQLVTLTGVDFVTRQGSIQNTTTSVAQSVPGFTSGVSAPAAPSQRQTTVPSQPHVSPTQQVQPVSAPTPEASASASPTLPVGEIDWDNDFNF